MRIRGVEEKDARSRVKSLLLRPTEKKREEITKGRGSPATGHAGLLASPPDCRTKSTRFARLARVKGKGKRAKRRRRKRGRRGIY